MSDEQKAKITELISTKIEAGDADGATHPKGHIANQRANETDHKNEEE
jgi:hypothetical protein